MGDEIARRLVHASGAAIPLSHAAAPALVAWELVQFFLVGALAVATILETLRLLGDLDWAIYDRLTREYEQDNPAGYALYMLSMTIVAFAAEPRVAIPAMLMLAIADPISGLLGSGELGRKQTWVLLATFGVATLLAVPFVPPPAAIAGGLAATVADGLKPVVAGYVVDDNLTIPPAAAVAMVAVLEFVPQ